jgi:multiple sugar transport system ATP-binding protein
MEVRLDNLSKHFTSGNRPVVKAVDEMNFTIPDGKLVGLLGPSGCGKSTTLYMIAGLHKPTGGKIWFGDTDVTEVPPENRGIGLVFQNYALYPHFTVRENIRFPLENVRPKLTKPQMEEIVQEMANIVGIGELLDRKPKELSGGQQQRVAIARALSKRPQVLLLDEPLSNLDARLRLQTREEIKRIQRNTGVTTIFVTHDQEEAMSISDFIVVMRKGVVNQIDEPQTVYEEPANLFVAKFLGSPAINIFEAELNGDMISLHGEAFEKGLLQGKGEFSLLDSRIYDIAVAGGYKESKKVFFADLGVDYVAPVEEVKTETEAVEKPKFSFNKIVANVKGKFAKKEKRIPDAEVVIAEAPAKLTVRHIYKQIVYRGYRPELGEFEEQVGKLYVESGANRPVKIGVRPESFTLEPNNNPPIQVEVKFIEHIGRDISIVGNVLGQPTSIRIIIPAEQRHNIKEQVVKVYPKRYYVFELSGERVK